VAGERPPGLHRHGSVQGLGSSHGVENPPPKLAGVRHVCLTGLSVPIGASSRVVWAINTRHPHFTAIASN
jgi:hypothetical protein